MQPQALILLLAAASASARPVPSSHDHGMERRELEYAQLVELAGEPDAWRHPGAAEHHAHHDEAGHGGRHFAEFDQYHRGPPPHVPHDHHHGGPHGDIVDNILEFFSLHVRSVPETSSRVLEGITDFLAHETKRDVPHPHGPRHEPHHHRNDDHAHGPHSSHVLGNILDFFASATRR